MHPHSPHGAAGPAAPVVNKRRRPGFALRAAAALLVISMTCLAGCSSDPRDTGDPTTGPPGSTASSAAAQSGAIVGHDRCSANRAAGTITYISPFGFDASAGILDVFAAEKLGYFDDLCLDVEFITHATSSSSLVSSNTAQVTNIGSAADLMNGVAHGANLVGVATYGDTSNYTLLTVPSITDLTQLDGKTLAYHGVLPIVLKQMLAAAGVDTDEMTMVLSNSYDPNQLFEGHYQALQAYRSNEPILLRAEGKSFHEFTPDQFGVAGTFNIQTFNGDFVADHPDAVADFLRAELHAFDYCTVHQPECVAILGDYAAKAGSHFDAEHAAAVWKFEAALAQQHSLPGRGVGVQTEAEWQPEYDLVNAASAKPLPEMTTFENTQIVAGLYDGTTLIWP